ncbi:hypothetical protein P4O66_010638, partial [Electrophorus voltai]
LAKDLLHPTPEEERRRHKKKRLVQSPNSYFMDVKCPGCYKITTVFSHVQTVVLCVGCSTVLCQPTGGKARLTEEEYREAKRRGNKARQDHTTASSALFKAHVNLARVTRWRCESDEEEHGFELTKSVPHSCLADPFMLDEQVGQHAVISSRRSNGDDDRHVRVVLRHSCMSETSACDSRTGHFNAYRPFTPVT